MTAGSGRTLDPHQQHLVDRLYVLDSVLSGDETNTDARRGLYVHGAVGRGKTWICDAFFRSAPTAAKRRMHLHDLLLELHRAIWRARSSAESAGQDVTELAIDALLGDIELLYIDEFLVHDSADAVLLSRVLHAVFERGILLLTTSNDAPDDLLPSREFHALAEPAIALIEAHLDVVELGGTLDYRRVNTAGRAEQPSGFASGVWISPTELDELARTLRSPGVLRRPSAAEHTVLSTNGHDFTARRAADGVVWFHFDDVCENATALADYLNWATEFHTWVIEGLPPLHAATPQGRQRFVHIVDVLVDRDVTLHIISDSSRREIALEAGSLDATRLHSRLALLRSVS
ncbi:cell division protein ZapE [Leifsonia kafniensis]|uniref:Cell division protein ZapE n=1 Tax=Leifsonia kafniensis TaxID=475957 RepID=A0ABP7KEC9_9MICO